MLRHRDITGTAGYAALTVHGLLRGWWGLGNSTVTVGKRHDRNGSEQLLHSPARAYTSARLSPDGQRVAVAAFANECSDIWIYYIKTERLNRLTSEGNSINPV